jgi:hypothetical protein
MQADDVREHQRPALDRERDARGVVDAPVGVDDLPVLLLEPAPVAAVALLRRALIRIVAALLQLLLAEVVQPDELRERDAVLGMTTAGLLELMLTITSVGAVMLRETKFDVVAPV